MRTDEPLDLPDESTRPVRQRRPAQLPPPGGSPYLPPAVVVWAVGKWFAFGAGCLFAVIAFFVDAVLSGGMAGLAVFCGVAAVLAQAEEHKARR